MSIQQMMAGGGPPVVYAATLPSNLLNTDVETFPDPAVGGIQFDDLGNWAALGNAGDGNLGGAWFVSGILGNFEVRCTPISGATIDGVATNTWLPLNSSVSWYVSVVGGTLIGDCLIEIRSTVSATVLASCSATFGGQST